ncbi:hypothetical protein BESB_009530 [Besnoitia besnoiti]|uniref:Uncharacterized protein n=1 Tax=Besnoitia besnoiti TaxID=94643 RepID=A0A2A9MPJ4_BESBE|nr:hypothetical protein BESB_009530 [Besnoitia besnoiti]PFH38611.1 hypothetical protein BESB_009530 [Besnoitia besnoiti]
MHFLSSRQASSLLQTESGRSSRRRVVSCVRRPPAPLSALAPRAASAHLQQLAEETDAAFERGESSCVGDQAETGGGRAACGGPARLQRRGGDSPNRGSVSFRSKRPKVRLGVQLDQTFPWVADLPQGVAVRHLSCAANHVALLTEEGRIFVYKIRQHPWQGAGFDTWLPTTSVADRRFVHVEIKSLDFGDAPLDVLLDPAYAPRPCALTPPSHPSSAVNSSASREVPAGGERPEGEAPARGEDSEVANSGVENGATEEETCKAEGRERATPERKPEDPSRSSAPLAATTCRCASREEDATSLFGLAALDSEGNLWLGSNAHCCCERPQNTPAAVRPSSSPSSSYASSSSPSSSHSSASSGSPSSAAPRPASSPSAASAAADHTGGSEVRPAGSREASPVPVCSENRAEGEGAAAALEGERKKRRATSGSPGRLTCSCGGRRPRDSASRRDRRGDEAARGAEDCPEDDRNEGRATGPPRAFQHCPMRMEAIRLPVSQGAQGAMEERGACLFFSLADLSPVLPATTPLSQDGASSRQAPAPSAVSPLSSFPFFPPLRFAVLCQSRLYRKRYGLIIRGRTLSCRASPLPHVPAKVVCGSNADCGLLLFTNGVAYQWQASLSETGKVVPGLRKVEGSLKDQRIVDIFGAQSAPADLSASSLAPLAAGGRGATGGGEFFLLDSASVLHEYNFGLGHTPALASSSVFALAASANSRRPLIPQPIECTPFCFDLLYGHPAGDRRIPYRIENFPKLLAALPKSYLLFILSLTCVSPEAVLQKYLFLPPGESLAAPRPLAPPASSAAAVPPSAASSPAEDKSDRVQGDLRKAPTLQSAATPSSPSSLSSSSSAFLSRCVEHFMRLRQSEIALLYRTPRLSRAASREKASLELEQDVCVVRLHHPALGPLASAPSPAPSSSSPSSQETFAGLSSLRRDAAASVQDAGEFLLLVRRSGAVEALQKPLFAVRMWRRGLEGQLLEFGGRRRETLQAISKWHIQELLQLHGELRLGMHVPSSLAAAAAESLFASAAEDAPASAAARLCPASPCALQLHLRLLDMASASAAPFRLFSGSGYVILTRYRVRRSGEFLSSFTGAVAPDRLVRVPGERADDAPRAAAAARQEATASPHASGERMQVAEAREAGGRRVESGDPSRPASSFPAFAGSSRAQRAPSSRRLGILSPTSFSGSLALDSASRGARTRDEENEGSGLPEPLRLLAADLRRHACAAAAENPRLFVRLADLQRVLLGRAQRLLRRYLKESESSNGAAACETPRSAADDAPVPRHNTPEERGPRGDADRASLEREEREPGAEARVETLDEIVSAFVSDLVAHFTLMHARSSRQAKPGSRLSSRGERGLDGGSSLPRRHFGAGEVPGRAARRRAESDGDDDKGEAKRRRVSPYSSAGAALAREDAPRRRERRFRAHGDRADGSRFSESFSPSFNSAAAGVRTKEERMRLRQRATGRHAVLLEQARRRRLLRLKLAARRRQREESAATGGSAETRTGEQPAAVDSDSLRHREKLETGCGGAQHPEAGGETSAHTPQADGDRAGEETRDASGDARHVRHEEKGLQCKNGLENGLPEEAGTRGKTQEETEILDEGGGEGAGGSRALNFEQRRAARDAAVSPASLDCDPSASSADAVA